METNDTKDVDFRTTLLVDLHKKHIKTLDERKDEFEYWAIEHLKVSGIYWGAAAMELVDSLSELNKTELVNFVVECQQPDGGFSGMPGIDSHLLYTLSAVQTMCIFDSLDRIQTDKVVEFVSSLQQPDGSFYGDKWGEVDTRFSYCAVSALSLLDRLDAIDVEAAISFVLKCQNFDGGFGCVPGAESHAGQIFTCVGTLAILEALNRIDADLLGWWLAERQQADGGLNGRPEKVPDVCYSWWVVSSLAMLKRTHWIDQQMLIKFILSCQDDDNGGIADHPGDVADVFHTFFGLAGLSFCGYKGLTDINPVYAMSTKTVNRVFEQQRAHTKLGDRAHRLAKRAAQKCINDAFNVICNMVRDTATRGLFRCVLRIEDVVMQDPTNQHRLYQKLAAEELKVQFNVVDSTTEVRVSWG